MQGLWDTFKALWIGLWSKESVRPKPLPPPAIIDRVLEPPTFIDRFTERNSTPEVFESHQKLLQAVSNARSSLGE